MRKEVANPDRLIAAIAGRQHGVISFQQLIAVGLDPSGISRRVRAGRLHRIHRGVYAVGDRNLSHLGWWMAAVLACGEGAALSHRSAAMNWGLLKPMSTVVDVAVPGSGGRSQRKGVRVHRSTSLTPKAVTIRHGISTTTPSRTILDLRRVLNRKDLQNAIAQAEIQHLPIGALPGFLHEPTRSELERRFLGLCRRYGVAKPEVNVKVGPYEVDFIWTDVGLIVETDGWETHGTRSAFELDRVRDAELQARGYHVVRFTYWQVTAEREYVARVLRQVFARRVI